MRLRSSSLVLFALLAAACSSGGSKKPTPTDVGTSTGAKVTKTLGASGGSLATTDGAFTLEFPMGALAADTEIGIEPITNKAPLGRGTAYRLTPDGSKFMQPVKMTFKYAAATHEGASADALRIAYQDKDGYWHTWTDTAVDGSASVITGTTKHFTDVSMVLGWQLTPFSARVSPLQQLNLQLKYCEPDQIDGPESELSGLTPRCDLEDSSELPRLVQISEWAVNGASGGSLGDGTVTGQGKAGTYTAPGVEPANNPVAVSCKFSTGLHGGTNIAVANVLIGASGWTGMVSWTLTGDKMTVEGEYTRTWKVNGNGTINVRPGPNEQAIIDSANNTYRYQYDEVVNQMYTQGACMHMLNQKTTEVLQGMSNMGASVIVTSEGTNSTIAIGVPAGSTTGNVVVDATDNVTGSGCTSPMPTHTDMPSTGTIPSDTLIINVNAVDRLNGSKTVRVDGTPPRDYAVTFDLSH